MDKVSVRYIVADVDAAIRFYTKLLGFQVDMHTAPSFASLSKGNLQLLLNQPGAGGAGQAMLDGQVPAPAAGIGSRSKWRIYQSPSRNCGVRDAGSVTRSWLAKEESKSSSMIHLAILSSCSSPPEAGEKAQPSTTGAALGEGTSERDG